MKKLYKFYEYYGRQGEVEGMFVEFSEVVDALIKDSITVDFGEILGKHSDVSVTLSEDNLTAVSDSPEVIKVIEEHVGEFGYNPVTRWIEDAQYVEEGEDPDPIVELHDRLYADE